MKLLQEQKLEQQLIMTYEMKQSLEVLQVSVTALKEIIEKEEEENPLLELQREYIDDYSKMSNEFQNENNYDKDNSRYALDDKDSTIDVISKIVEDDEDIFSKILKEINLELRTKSERVIIEYILKNLNKMGFFEEDFITTQDVLQEEYNFYIEEEYFEKIRMKLVCYEPLGLGTRGIAEFIKIQIDDDEDTPQKIAINKILDNFFDDFTRKKVRELTKNVGIDQKMLKKIYERVAMCRPYPLHGYLVKKEIDLNIVPEVTVEYEKGEYLVTLNDKYLPRFKMNREYYEALSKDKEALDYLKEKAMRIRNLEKSIEQRNITLYRVTKEIVKIQKDFLRRGEKFLKPLTLYEIGEKLNLHESTISRVVNAKYISTPRGIYELKYFFSGKVETGQGRQLSITAVQELIKELVVGENKYKPYTDKEICGKLNEYGIKVSQRTVANYRETIKILPTYLRKEL